MEKTKLNVKEYSKRQEVYRRGVREGVSAGKRRTQTDQRRKIKIFDNEKYDGGWPSYFSVERLCLS